MAADAADLEFGLVWDSDQEGFEVSLRFTDESGVDQLAHPREAVHVDLAELNRLVDDEEAYGAALTAMVFKQAEIRNFYLQTIAVAQTVPVHLRIHLDGPARFHNVRWESLREPGEAGLPIATTSNVLFSRFLSSMDWRPIPARTEREHWALVVIAAPSDLDGYQPGRRLSAVDLEGEVARARKALAGYQLVVLGGNGQAAMANVAAHLDRAGEDFEVLYLVAHGALIEDVPRLYLESSDGTADVIDARQLVEHFCAIEHKPTLAMLVSCQSAEAGDAATSSDGGALVGIGPCLAGAGVPAVIAMQGNVTVATAHTFATTFFEAFAESPIVDRAMAKARMAVRDRPDWWMPVLFSRLRSGRAYYEPGFTKRGEETWKTLVLMLCQRKLTPVLGPGLTDSILGSRSEIARRWVRRWQMPIHLHEQGNLARVAQYLRVGRAPGVVRTYLDEYLMTDLRERRESAHPGDPLADLPAELFDGPDPVPAIHEIGRCLREHDQGDPYRVAAALQAPVFVTTGWTDLLQQAMRARTPAVQPRTFCFPWYRGAEWVDIDGVDVAGWEAPTVERPWVCHLFGRLDQTGSLVLTEDDYFAWLSAWIAQRPGMPNALSALSKSLTSKSLLFLGYQLGDWDFRVVFQSIRSFGGSDLLRENLHVGVQLRPETESVEPEAAQRYLESYFGNDNVSIFWSDTRRFLDELRTRLKLPT